MDVLKPVWVLKLRVLDYIGKEGDANVWFFQVDVIAYQKVLRIKLNVTFDLTELFYSSFDHSKRLILSFATVKTRVKKLR